VLKTTRRKPYVKRTWGRFESGRRGAETGTHQDASSATGTRSTGESFLSPLVSVSGAPSPSPGNRRKRISDHPSGFGGHAEADDSSEEYGWFNRPT
jgi:hypothetical protein